MTTEPPSTDESTPAAEPGAEGVPRLHRRGSRRVIAGVASGLADRFDVNENLVRAVFIALTFLWGLGVALYLVLWAVLPTSSTDGTLTPGAARAPLSTSHRLGAAVIAALVVLAILSVALTKPLRLLAPGVGAAWVLFLLGLAVVALRTPARRLTWRRVFAILFLVVSSVIIVLIGGAMGFLASTGVPLTGGNGQHVWQPTTLANVRHDYRGQFGEGILDLRAIHFPSTGFHISASIAAGTLRIVVPSDAVVDLTTNVGIGSVFEGTSTTTGEISGPFTAVPSGVGATTPPPLVSIDARVGVGKIYLTRVR